MSASSAAGRAEHRIRRATVGVALLALMATGLPTASAYPRPGRTEVVSLDNEGDPAGRGSGVVSAAASDDLSVIAFWTLSNIDPNDTLNLSTDLYARDRRTGQTEWVSQGQGGAGHIHGSFTEPAVSGDGRYVAFGTIAPLVPGDSNGTTDIFVRDLATGTTEMISDVEPGPVTTPASSPDISGDGRYVAYSQAPGPGAETQVLLRDREQGTVEVVSIGSLGEPMPGSSTEPSLSGDGGYVAFSNQPAPSAPWEVYVRDRVESTSEKVSAGSVGAPPVPLTTWAWAGSPSISDDGRYVAFLSAAGDLIPRDTNLATDVFVHDRETGDTERISVTSAGGEAAATMGPPLGGSVYPAGPSAACVGLSSLTQVSAPYSSFYASISPDGRYVSFISSSGNLVSGDTNSCYDAFVHDRLLRTTERVSVSSVGQQAVRAAFGTPPISADGRYVAFHHFSDLEPNDTNKSTDTYLRDRGPGIGVGHLDADVSGGTVQASGWATLSGTLLASSTGLQGEPGAGDPVLNGASLAYRHELEDLLARLSLAIPPVAGAGIAYGMRFSVASITYEARIDETGATLHRCTPECTQTATLQGSIGTTGNEALIAIPRSAVGAAPGSTVTGLRAFTRVGVAGQELDAAELPAGQIPEAVVSLGIAPAGTPEADVEFATAAALTSASFSGSIDVSSMASGEYDFWALACLGDACGATSTRITLG